MWAQTPAEIGKIIEFARRRRGLTQAQLAGEVGTTQTWISSIEKGKTTAHIGKVLGVLSHLNIRLKVGDTKSTAAPPKSSAISLSNILATHSALRKLTPGVLIRKLPHRKRKSKR